MKRRWIINNSVRSSERVRRSVERVFPNDQVLISTSMHDLCEYLHRYRRDLCIIVGGDGSWSRALAECEPKQIMGYFPAGTINQSILELKQSDRLAAWHNWDNHEVSVGGIISESKSTPFFMMLGVGVEADAVRIVQPWIKRVLGRGAYIVAILERLLRPVRMSITVDIGEKTWVTSQVLMLNGKYYAGDHQVTTATDVFQPEYSLIVWKYAGRFNWLCGMLTRMFQLKISELWTDEIKIAGDEVQIRGKANVQIDGDPGPELPLIVCKTTGQRVAVSSNPDQ